jgi:hypothetical protein
MLAKGRKKKEPEELFRVQNNKNQDELGLPKIKKSEYRVEIQDPASGVSVFYSVTRCPLGIVLRYSLIDLSNSLIALEGQFV